MARALEVSLLALAFAGGTWLTGWWAIPLIAGAWALWRRGGTWMAPAAAAVGWDVLLLLLPFAPLGRLLTRLDGLLPGPPPLLLLLPLGFAAGLAWSIATLARAVGRRGDR